MYAPGPLRFLYETMRYSMLARGLRFDDVALPEGSVVDSLSFLDGRPLYRRMKQKAGPAARGRVRHDGGFGEDPPLGVFLHGLGSSVATWANVLPTFARRVPLVAPDLPGFGRTRLPEEAPFATLREHVDAAHSFIEVVSPDAPVQLVGQSLGGWIAARVAAERPDRVSRLTLVNATGVMHPQIFEQRRLFSPHNEDELVELWQRMWFRLPATFRLLRKQFLELTRTPIVRGVMDTVQAQDFLDEVSLGRIEAATLLVWGLEDRLVDYDMARAYRQGIRDVRFRPIPHCGHVPQREAPRVFLRYVLPWMMGREPPEPERPGTVSAVQDQAAGGSEAPTGEAVSRAGSKTARGVKRPKARSEA